MAKTSPRAAPANAAEPIPRIALPVDMVTPNPTTAPISIMPSTPRLRTPERSTTSSPTAATSIGVAAITVEPVGPENRSCRGGLPAGLGGLDADAVADEEIRSEQVE